MLTRSTVRVTLAKTCFTGVDTAVLEELCLRSCCQNIAKTDLFGEAKKQWNN